MIWRTCGSVRRSSARSAYSTRAVGFVDAGGDEPQVLRGVGVVAQLAQAAGQLGRGPERRHPVAADQPRDRRVVDARLLGELSLRHLLGLELGSKPFVERSSVLGRHVSAWALRPDRPMALRPMPRWPNYRCGARRSCITRWYRASTAPRRPESRSVWCGRAGSRAAWPERRPRTKVRGPSRRPDGHAPARSRRRAGADRQAAVAAERRRRRLHDPRPCRAASARRRRRSSRGR